MRTLYRAILTLNLLAFIVVYAWPEQRAQPLPAPERWTDTFWWPYWGESGTHKGIDIYALRGTPVVSATAGIVVFAGRVSLGGNAVLVFAPGWRLHYYAHMDTLSVRKHQVLGRGAVIGTVGNTGNAKGKAPHLHHEVMSLVPMPWKAQKNKPQGNQLMLYIHPGEYYPSLLETRPD